MYTTKQQFRKDTLWGSSGRNICEHRHLHGLFHHGSGETVTKTLEKFFKNILTITHASSIVMHQPKMMRILDTNKNLDC